MTEKRWTPGEAIHAFARENPDQPVVICAREDGATDQLSRAQLDVWSSQLAHHLIARGVDTGDYVAINLPTCVRTRGGHHRHLQGRWLADAGEFRDAAGRAGCTCCPGLAACNF